MPGFLRFIFDSASRGYTASAISVAAAGRNGTAAAATNPLEPTAQKGIKDGCQILKGINIIDGA